jgi:DNA-binding response OmpR family regulator
MESHKRVLIVDDDPEVGRMLSSALIMNGLLVDLASDGRQALDAIRENNYSVVLLDLMMPLVDGFGVLDDLDAQALTSPPVVLVLTSADRSVIDRLDSSRIHGVVRKPFDPKDLAALVLACTDIKGRSGFGTMAIATIVSGAPFLAWLVKS